MGKGLKAALRSQQYRLRIKEKAQIAAQAALRKGRNASSQSDQIASTPRSKGKGKEKQFLANQQPTIPFRLTDEILLVGEGNFSFTRALALNPSSVLDSLPPRNITTTTYDTEQECYRKYHDAEEIVQMLKRRGVEVLFRVDATKLEKVQRFKGRKWDRIVWNFPHAGKGITDKDRNILSNQILILDFLRSASGFLKNGPVPLMKRKKRKNDGKDEEDDAISDDSGELPCPTDLQIAVRGTVLIAVRGTVLITLRNVPPYTLWDVPRLAKNPPHPTSTSKPPNPQYLQLRSFVFHRGLWTGYEHRMTKGERAHGTGKTGEGGEDRTWEFCLRD